MFHCKALVKSSTQNLAIGDVSSAGTPLDVATRTRLGRFLQKLGLVWIGIVLLCEISLGSGAAVYIRCDWYRWHALCFDFPLVCKCLFSSLKLGTRLFGSH